jgi:hypothetical protein
VKGKNMDQTNNTVTSTSTTEVAAVSLNLADLKAFCQIVEVCTQRGAFRAEELAGVGALYDKTMAFLKQSGAKNEPETAAQPEAPAETN